MYSVTEDQLDTFYSLGTRRSLFLTVAGILIGAFVAVLLMLIFTDGLSTDEKAGLIGAVISTGALSVLLGIEIVWDAKRRDSEFRRFKGQDGRR